LASDELALQSPAVVSKPDMNGDGSKIEIFKPFEEAFELMKKILFQPFDLKKWLVIGFAAWLANLGGGGVGANYPDNRREEAHKLNETISQIPQPVLITAICILICLVLLLIVLFAWLRARGRFVLVDCIVRNRAAIVEPWKEFRAEGNSFFLFSLLVVLVLIAVIVIAGLALIVPFIPWSGQRQPGVAFWIGLSLFVFVAVCLAFVWVLASQLIVPIMYRQRCRARRAFAQAVDMVSSHPGPILLYVLFLLLLGVAAVMIGCAVTCATCCIAAIPYIGTVILLPIPVTLGAFSLLFLRQFGPEYDVWAGFMPPEFLPVLLPPPAPSGNEAS
jgi:multisubunit Na+/H+ antiporter MnhC subunit